jgi:type IV secretion system protein VirB9
VKALIALCGLAVGSAAAAPVQQDQRLRDVVYEAEAVVTVYAKRGVTTHVLLDAAERIQFIATGIGSECARDEDTWCITAPKFGTQLFVKPKKGAQGSNNIAIATDRRAYSLRFVVVGDDDPREAVYRLTFVYPAKRLPAVATVTAPEIPSGPSESELLAMRLKQSPELVNGDYSIAVGKRSDDIAPTMVWDDGRFTYFKFPNNREIPTVFQIDGTGQESVVNARMEGDFLVADLISRQFYLRRGRAVVGVWNESFDLDGVPAKGGTTVPGIERVERERVGANK